ncbi:MAG: hypothetical protein ACXWF8_03825 [Methylobacter sp.]
MKKMNRILVGASLLAIAGGVSAEPVMLSANQMDGVNAGAVIVLQGAADSTGGAFAVSNLLGLSDSKSVVVVTPVAGFVASGTQSGAIASSTFNPYTPSTNGAAAFSGASSSSALF